MNGLTPEDAADGVEAHKMMQIMLLGIYGSKVRVEPGIPGGSLAGGVGRADVVYINEEVMEVYEIKPGAYAKPGTKRNREGKAQRDRYIQGLELQYPEVMVSPGRNLNPIINLTTLPSLRHPDKLIKYYTYPQDPGMIYWRHINKHQGERVPVKEKETEIDWETARTYAISGALIILGLIGLVMYGDFTMVQKGAECFG